ncbi:MAG: hypothetical protein EA384_09135 [Spirochaetaceae bacterium]|nr:MAG: hypothetical protein EA384_09135 [Spirochaetaceae bacterium]
MENYTHASIIIASGVITNETTVTVQECSNAGASATNAIGFSYYAIDGNGVTGARTTVDASGFATGTTDNRVWVIELDATQLTDGYPWVRVMLSAAATHAGAVLVVLSGARYAQANPPAAI